MSPFLLYACAELSNSSGKQIVLATAFVQARNFSALKVWGAEEANMGDLNSISPYSGGKIQYFKFREG